MEIASAAALVLSWILCGLLIRLAPRLGLVDLPDPARKVHRAPTPRAGGLGIVAGFGVGVLLLPGDRENLIVFSPALVLVLLGFLDDYRTVRWQARLVVQTLCAVAGVWLLAPESGPLFPVAVVWVVGLVNAFNMLDNMDLLSGGTALVTAGCLALAGNSPDPFVVLMAALVGFLWYNRPVARLFMGDAGSTFLGYVLAVGSLRLVLKEQLAQWWVWLAPFALMAVPWYDLTTVVRLRLRQGRSPFHADKQHLSHRLVAAGLKPVVAVEFIHLLALASGAAAVVIYQTTQATPAIIVVSVLTAVWLAVALVDRGITRRWFPARRGD